MKRQIRRGVFETNSSSVHSLTMCSDDDFQKWKDGEVLFRKWEKEFVTIDELKKEFANEIDWNNEDEVEELLSDKRIETYDEFFNEIDFETFEQEYTTPSGDKVIGFGYYGHD